MKIDTPRNPGDSYMIRDSGDNNATWDTGDILCILQDLGDNRTAQDPGHTVGAHCKILGMVAHWDIREIVAHMLDNRYTAGFRMIFAHVGSGRSIFKCQYPMIVTYYTVFYILCALSLAVPKNIFKKDSRFYPFLPQSFCFKKRQ